MDDQSNHKGSNSSNGNGSNNGQGNGNFHRNGHPFMARGTGGKEVVLFAKEHAKFIGRDASGKFAVGHSGNPAGRPRSALASLCRGLSNKYQLVQRIAQIGAGKGQFKKVDPMTQLRACQIIVAYGFGTPQDVFDSEQLREASENANTLTKRIIGVPDDAV